MSGYVKHEPCPRCRENGKDTKGDNLARYRNGAAYCFSCFYKERPTNWKPTEPKTTKAKPDDLVAKLPQANIDWLKQYLSYDQIMLNFKYSPSMDRHVFTYHDYWEARSVNPDKPKVISSGTKPFFIWGSYHNTDKLVVVEDVVSAIRVGQECMSLCLFGSHLSGDWMTKIAKNKRIRTVIIWLDNDKMKESRAFADKLRLLGLTVHSTTTEKDPKCYTGSEIRRIIHQ